jgi:hypothetical protein
LVSARDITILAAGAFLSFDRFDPPLRHSDAGNIIPTLG